MKDLADNIFAINSKDKEDWAKLQELKARPSVRAKLRKFEKEILDEELAKQKMLEDIANNIKS